MSYPTIPFERTSCDCDVCKVGCRTMPGSLIPGDLDRICEYTGHEIGSDWVLSNFLASDGGKVGVPCDDGSMLFFEVPSITPRQKEDGRCVFLDDEDHCKIHQVAPFSCAYHDMHMDDEEAHARSNYAIWTQIDGHPALDGFYRVGALMLHEMCHHSPDLEDHDHDQAFYEEYHDNSELIGQFAEGCLSRLPQITKQIGRKLTKMQLRNEDTVVKADKSLTALLKDHPTVAIRGGT